MRRGLLQQIASLPADLPVRLKDTIEQTAAAGELVAGTFTLAARQTDQGIALFFGFADDATERDISDLIRAFVGVSFARRRPVAALVAGDDTFAAELRSLAPDPRIHAMLIAPDRQTGALAAVERLLAVRQRRPETVAILPRQLARILRDLEDAIDRRELGQATALLGEAIATGRLSLSNKSLLEARLLVARADWRVAVEHAVRHRLPDLPLPPPVERDLIEAVWHRWLAEPFAAAPAAALTTYRIDVAPQAAGLFRDHRLAASPGARIAWLIHYAALDPPPVAAMREVVDRAPTDERPSLQAACDALVLPASTPEPPADIGALQSAGEHAAAYAEAQASEGLTAVTQADALVRSAQHLDDPVRLDEALVTAQATAVDLGTVLAAAHLTPEAIADQPFAAVDDWGAWLRVLYEHPTSRAAMRVLEQGAKAWAEKLSDRDEFEEWADVIEVLAGVQAFRLATPQLVDAVLPCGVDAAQIAMRRRRVLEALAYAIASEPAPGLADLDAIARLAEVLVVAGIDVDGYEKLTGQLEGTFRRLSAPPRLARWVLDVVELLIKSPAPAEDARDQAVRRLLAPLLPDAQRARPLIPPEVWTEVAELIGDRDALADVIAPVAHAAADTDDDGLAELAGHTVLLHTLVPNAAERAREYLLGRVSATIWTDGSKTGSGHLKERSRRAAIVVVASRAAKHAAFETIQAAAGDRLHYASGKGWSSLVTAVRDAVAGLG